MPEELPLAYVQRVAAEKSALCITSLEAILKKLEFPILAADTAVVLDGSIMGKPKDQEDGIAMLSRSCRVGRTRFTLQLSLRGNQHWQAISVTEVTFRELSEREILAYWQTGEPIDKAGSYAIQGLGGLFVESIKGSYSGVMGLPLFETATLLAKEGINLLA